MRDVNEGWRSCPFCGLSQERPFRHRGDCFLVQSRSAKGLRAAWNRRADGPRGGGFSVGQSVVHKRTRRGGRVAGVEVRYRVEWFGEEPASSVEEAMLVGAAEPGRELLLEARRLLSNGAMGITELAMALRGGDNAKRFAVRQLIESGEVDFDSEMRLRLVERSCRREPCVARPGEGSEAVCGNVTGAICRSAGADWREDVGR